MEKFIGIKLTEEEEKALKTASDIFAVISNGDSEEMNAILGCNDGYSDDAYIMANHALDLIDKIFANQLK